MSDAGICAGLARQGRGGCGSGADGRRRADDHTHSLAVTIGHGVRRLFAAQRGCSYDSRADSRTSIDHSGGWAAGQG